MFQVYFLYSETFDKTYIGFTSNLEARLLSHNQLGKKDWATRFRPWTLIHKEEFDNKQDALARERFFKTGKVRLELQSILYSKGFRL